MLQGEGDHFAGYTIKRLLGSGEMGEVYLADHPRLPRQDALKILPSNISADSSFRERFIAKPTWPPRYGTLTS
jgi:serine/threonine protein kinase, bacterial